MLEIVGESRIITIHSYPMYFRWQLKRAMKNLWIDRDLIISGDNFFLRIFLRFKEMKDLPKVLRHIVLRFFRCIFESIYLRASMIMKAD